MIRQRGEAGVGVTTMTFRDDSRPTMANGTFPGLPYRELVTEIWYPADPDPAAPAEGIRDGLPRRDAAPYPLVVASHGFMDNRSSQAYLNRHLASYGYVVAAPDFPLTRGGAPGGPMLSGGVEQPGDISFLIDQLAGLSNDAGGRFADTIDTGNVGLVGVSWGGMTTYLTALHPTLRDSRVRAAAAIAAAACFFGDGFFTAPAIPLLVLHGDIDAITPYAESALAPFERAKRPKYLATIAAGTHSGFVGLLANAPAGLNVDEIGCAQLGPKVSTDPTPFLAFLDRLDGAEYDISFTGCRLPCEVDGPRPPSIRPGRQHELAILTVLPFFDAYLRDRANARVFLEQAVAAENPELSVVVER